MAMERLGQLKYLITSSGIDSLTFLLVAQYLNELSYRVPPFKTMIKRNLLKQGNKIYLLTPWPESTSELYRQSDGRLSAKLVPSFTDRGCQVVSVTDPYGRNLGFLDRKDIK
jgi:hypothetical protein